MNTRRLFFALWPSDRQREILWDTLRPVLTSVEGTVVDRRDWHVTVVFIGDFPEDQIPFLQAAAEGVEREQVRLRFDRLTFWPRPKIACLQPLGVPSSLQQLVRSLTQILKALDVEPDDRVYRPHITVARRARTFDDLMLSRPIDLEWTDFELIESLAGPTGVQYQPLKQ